MTPTVFYSWHSDLNEDANRYFIREALSIAVSTHAEVSEPEMRYDDATEGLSGTPDIPASIFEKLSTASVAVFDVTPVGETLASGTRPSKKLLNPNVALELGFAASTIGWERIILVFNKGYGDDPSCLPFDLKHRRFPLCYKATNDNELEKKKVSGCLKNYIKAALQDSNLAFDKARRRLSRDCIELANQFRNQSNFAFNTQSDHSAHSTTIHRLLDLGFIGCDFKVSPPHYSYYWTYLGNQLCEWFASDQAKSNG